MPTVIEPLREEWAAAQTASATLEKEGNEGGARIEIEKFHRRLCSVKVLDPACGSGNFLYVTLEHLKRLEAEVLEVLAHFPGQLGLDMTGGYTVSPAQFLGLEVNPRAAAIADVVLWIGYLQWHLRTYGDAKRLNAPVLREYHNIRQQDAVLSYRERMPRLDAQGQPITRWDGRTTKAHPVTGQEVPDESARIPVYDYLDPTPAQWPQADFIVGNPPFIGTSRMRDALGDGYTEALRKTYAGKVPESADFVMFWWYKASELVRAGSASRFGFITTNSLKQAFNRRVLQSQMTATHPISLVMAIPDHPWVDSELAAAVTTSMTVATTGIQQGRLLTVVSESKSENDLGRNVVLTEKIGSIREDLTIGADVVNAKILRSNLNLSSRGVQLYGAGFILTLQEAQQLGYHNATKHPVIKPYLNGQDVTGKTRNAFVIDFYGSSAEEARANYPAAYQRIVERVKPERDQSNEERVKVNWWLHGRTREELRNAIVSLSRYIATVETAKHRFFVFVDQSVLPDNKLIAIATEDAYHLGILSSKLHVTWALAAGSDLGGNTPVYVKTLCFETFPFPTATEGQKEKIRNLAEQLNAHRKARQAAHSTLTMTDMYNVLEKLRSGVALNEKDKKVHTEGLVSVLKQLHDELDAAVAEAYGWPVNLKDEEILERLVALNAVRAEGEARGLIRYLRPEYQNPVGTQQGAFEMQTGSKDESAKAAEKELLPWPSSLAEQAQSVQRMLQLQDRPALPSDLLRQFKAVGDKKQREKRLGQIGSLLETLHTLGLARKTEEGKFSA